MACLGEGCQRVLPEFVVPLASILARFVLLLCEFEGGAENFRDEEPETHCLR